MGWEALVKDFNIPSRRGSGGDNIEIHCPYCGASDRSKHLGLHCTSTRYGCWKGKGAHSGRNPSKLLQVLLNISPEEALTVAMNYFEISDYDWTIESGRNCLLKSIQIPDVPVGFKSFTTTSESYDALSKVEKNTQAVFGAYLVDRGFPLRFVVDRFNLKYAVEGDYMGRVIIPICWNKNMLSWTGRAITDNLVPRYKACNTSAYAPDMFLLDSDNLTGGKALLVCEGAFDAMKVTSCLINGVHGTSLFGKSISAQQINLLMAWAEIYETIYICLDRGEMKDSLRLKNMLDGYIPNVKTLFSDRKDFGETPIPELTQEIQQKCKLA